MDNISGIMDLAKKNKGIITVAMVTKAGFSRGSLKYMTDRGYLTKASRGVYILPDAWEDEFVNLQSRYKRGIFSMGTALFLCDLTDRTPFKYHMTFPASYNLTGPKKDGVICYGTKEEFYNLGITELLTPSGQKVRAYCAERTLCELLKVRNHTDIQLLAEAFKRYLSRKDKNIPLLSEYARILNVTPRLSAYLEVLI